MLVRLLALRVRQGGVLLFNSLREEIDALMSAVRTRMLATKPFGDPERRDAIAETLLSRVVRCH
jgi:hypothetical protein